MQTILNHKLLPYIALVFGVAALGFSAMFIRWATVPGPVTAFYRNLFALVFLTPVALFRYRPVKNKKTLIFPVLGGIFTAIDISLWSIAVQTTSAGTATLLNGTAPLWVALAAWLFFGERLEQKFWLGLALTLAGAGLITGIDFSTHIRLGIGDGLALLSGCFYTAYFLSTQKGRQQIGLLAYIWIVTFCTVAGLYLINRSLGNSLTGFPLENWWIFVSYALTGQLVGYAALTYALGRLPATIVAPSMVGQPILTILAAVPLLGEIPSPVQVAGSVLALIGIYLVHQTYHQGKPARNTRRVNDATNRSVIE
ncbi:MAG: DMT family transporter [Anaerolineales bacterium]|nr:DMT family transporter [Anaerolineales bacterium]